MNEEARDAGLINVAGLDLDELAQIEGPGMKTALSRILATSYEPGYSFGSSI